MPRPNGYQSGQPAGRGRNATADRAIDILLLFSESSPVLSAVEVSRRLRMPRSTTYRYLQSLRAAGLIEEDDARGGFRLGPRVFQLARVARIGLGLSEIALPYMRSLATATGEAVLLTRRSGDHVVCIERIESSHPVRISYERGHVMPIHAGASAKVLLAFMDQEEIEAVLLSSSLRRFTERTVVDPDQLRAQLEEIRRSGYAVSEGEVDLGVRGIAAPILGEHGQVVAGLSVVGPTFRLGDDVLPHIIASVKETAEAIGRRLRETSE